jgi:hypothetical protein
MAHVRRPRGDHGSLRTSGGTAVEERPDLAGNRQQFPRPAILEPQTGQNCPDRGERIQPRPGASILGPRSGQICPIRGGRIPTTRRDARPAPPSRACNRHAARDRTHTNPRLNACYAALAALVAEALASDAWRGRQTNRAATAPATALPPIPSANASNAGRFSSTHHAAQQPTDRCAQPAYSHSPMRSNKPPLM